VKTDLSGVVTKCLILKLRFMFSVSAGKRISLALIAIAGLQLPELDSRGGKFDFGTRVD
jgi:hypothetical protein